MSMFLDGRQLPCSHSGTQFPSILWLHQVSEIVQFRSYMQKGKEDYAFEVAVGQAWEWYISLCLHCIVNLATWPYLTAKETGKCIKLCAHREKEVGFGEHIAITTPETLAYCLPSMSLIFLTNKVVKSKQYNLPYSVTVKITFVKCLI